MGFTYKWATVCLRTKIAIPTRQRPTTSTTTTMEIPMEGIYCAIIIIVICCALTMIRKESTEQMSRGRRKDKSPQLCSTISVVEANYYYYHNNHHPAPPRHHPRQKQHRNSPLFRQNFKISANPICTLLFANSLICVSHSPPASPMSETRRHCGS